MDFQLHDIRSYLTATVLNALAHCIYPHLLSFGMIVLFGALIEYLIWWTGMVTRQNERVSILLGYPVRWTALIEGSANATHSATARASVVFQMLDYTGLKAEGSRFIQLGRRKESCSNSYFLWNCLRIKMTVSRLSVGRRCAAQYFMNLFGCLEMSFGFGCFKYS